MGGLANAGRDHTLEPDLGNAGGGKHRPMPQLSLNPAQARFVYLFAGFAPVATCVVTPLVVNTQLKARHVPESQRKLLFSQEIIRQSVSGVIGLLSYFGGATLASKLMKNSAHQSMGKMLGGTAISFVGYGLLRPLISTELVVRWIQNNFQKPLLNAPEEPPVTEHPPFATDADNRLQQFMHGSNRFKSWG